MYDRSDTTEPLPVLAVEPVPQSWPALAWLLIVAIVAFVVWKNFDWPAAREKVRGEGLASQALVFQAKFLVAAANTVGKSDPRLAEQLDALQAETPHDRLRVAVVAGEILGPDKARQRLASLTGREAEAAAEALIVGGTAQAVLPGPPSSRSQELAEILDRLYRDYEQKEFAGPALEEAERARLRSELGWFGELALNPAKGPDAEARDAALQPAFRMFFGIMGAFAVVGVVGVGGFIGLLVFFVMLLTGKIRPLVRESTGRGGVYVETFALWLVLFVGLSHALGFLPGLRLGLVYSGLAMLLSLAALCWPVVRGIPWRQVRQDIGLTAGRSPFLEPFVGLGTYAMALPLVFVAAILTILLLQTVLGPAARPPAHPVAEAIPGLSWWGKVQVFFLACILAPIVEEIVFRGLLYRHLREASHGLGQAVSVLCSAVLVSFIFAVVHPQGVFGVPALMALAFAFTLAREWRGTLVPSMVAHAVTNGLSLLAVTLLFGD